MYFRISWLASPTLPAAARRFCRLSPLLGCDARNRSLMAAVRSRAAWSKNRRWRCGARKKTRRHITSQTAHRLIRHIVVMSALLTSADDAVNTRWSCCPGLWKRKRGTMAFWSVQHLLVIHFRFKKHGSSKTSHLMGCKFFVQLIRALNKGFLTTKNCYNGMWSKNALTCNNSASRAGDNLAAGFLTNIGGTRHERHILLAARYWLATDTRVTLQLSLEDRCDVTTAITFAGFRRSTEYKFPDFFRT